MVQMSICRGAACGTRSGFQSAARRIWYIFNMKELSCQNTLSVREEIMERIRRPLISGRPMWNMWRRSTECIIRRPDDLAVLSRESGSRRQSTRWDHLRTAAWWRTPGELMTRCQTRLTRMLYGTKSAAIWCMAHSLAESISRS
jgi:hypothetical protein